MDNKIKEEVLNASEELEIWTYLKRVYYLMMFIMKMELINDLKISKRKY